MKIIFSIVLIISFQTYSWAQFEKNTIYVAGLGNYSYQQQSNLSGNQSYVVQNLMLNPSVGIFPHKKIILGVEGGWLVDKGKSEYQSSYSMNKSSSYTVGPFVRLYSFGGLFFQANYFLGAGIVETEEVIVSQTGSVTRNHSETRAEVNGYSFTPGYSIFVDRNRENRKVAIDIMIGYTSISVQSARYKGFTVGFGVSGFLFKN